VDAGVEEADVAPHRAFGAQVAEESLHVLAHLRGEARARFVKAKHHARESQFRIEPIGDEAHRLHEFAQAMQREKVRLERQENILRALAVAVRDVDRNRLNTANRECHEISNSCINFATTYESRLVEGLCTPRSAPILLNIFDRLQTLVHNELETVKLLSRWIWDCVAMGSEEYRDVHYSY